MVEQLDYLNYINGQWVGDSYKKIKVFNPATGEYIGSVPDADEEHAKQAIEAASQALPKWSKKSAADRSDVLRKYYDLIMTHENGMPSNDRRRVVDTVSLCSNIVCGNPI